MPRREAGDNEPVGDPKRGAASPPPHDDGVEHVLEDQGCKDETEHEEDGAERHRGRNGRAARKVPHLDLAKCSL